MERALRRAGARHRGELRSGGPGGEGLRPGGGAAGFVGMGRDATGSAHGLQVQQARSSAHSGRAQRSRRGWHAVWRTPAASWQACSSVPSCGRACHAASALRPRRQGLPLSACRRASPTDFATATRRLWSCLSARERWSSPQGRSRGPAHQGRPAGSHTGATGCS